MIAKENIHFYSSAKELPIYQYHLLNKYALMQMGKGTTIEDLVQRFAKLDRFLGAEKIMEARQELANIYQGMFSALQGDEYRSLMLACLVAKIDNVRWEDFSEEGLKELVARMDGLSMGEAEATLDQIKKKWMAS